MLFSMLPEYLDISGKFPLNFLSDSAHSNIRVLFRVGIS
ncbi:hypothetical protein HTG_08310 [Natrinema mahii]|nr:hypothetical protein HTG_08310 [Natrinema mahii]